MMEYVGEDLWGDWFAAVCVESLVELTNLELGIDVGGELES